MESNQSLYLKKGVWVSVFEAHSNERMCDPVCSALDLSVVWSTCDCDTKGTKGLWKWLWLSLSVDFKWAHVCVRLMYVGVCALSGNTLMYVYISKNELIF